MIEINPLGANFIVTVICIIVMLIAAKYGDSEKKTDWMFFLGIIAIGVLAIYWITKVILLLCGI